ncbi:hypothetical protein BRC91_00385 [Halobacteriales archaeon QS_4_62_28]|nr:MAG: hypothetical protein BRC91_00385 [Halobacteriales archaeon QS_4_62_28]
MTSEQQLFDDAPIRRYEYSDALVLAADLSVVGDTSVDVVDETVIVVADGEQHDFEVPDGNVQAFIRNGVLTVEMTTEVSQE